MDRLDELAVLIAVCDAGTLAGAARTTGRSPAMVSRVIQGMERRLGVRLVERTTRRTTITEAGRALRDRASAILADYEESLGRAQATRLAAAGTLRVAAPLVLGRTHLAPVVTGFLRLHPQVRVQIHLSNGIVDLVQQRVDVALRVGRVDGERLVAKRIGHVRRILVASPAYVRTHGEPRSIAELHGHCLILQAHGEQPHQWRFASAGDAFVPEARLVVDDAQVAIDAACEGYGIARPFSYQAAEAIAQGRLVRLLPDAEPDPSPVSLLYKDPQYLPLRVRAFVDHAAQHLKCLLSA